LIIRFVQSWDYKSGKSHGQAKTGWNSWLRIPVFFNIRWDNTKLLLAQVNLIGEINKNEIFVFFLTQNKLIILIFSQKPRFTTHEALLQISP
jgi:hypothetical protein